MDKEKKHRFKIFYIRIITTVSISLLFVLSFRADIQILEGSLSGSRMAGLHLTDPFIALEVLLTNGFLPVNLIIGVCTILLFYMIFGGRIFCSWVCPYGLISEFAAVIRHKLIEKRFIKDFEFHINRYFFFIFWIVMTLSTGILFFEMFNLAGITSRLIIYGFSSASVLVFIMLAAEIFFGRFWCSSVCPIGTLYGTLSFISAGKIKWSKAACNECGRCVKACYDKTILSKVTENKSGKSEVYINDSGCTMCCRCMESCHTGSFKYANKIKNII